MKNIELFHKNRKLVLCQGRNVNQKKDLKHVYIYNEDELINVKDIINDFFEDDKMKEVYIFYINLSLLLDKLKSNYKYIEAAGGIVKNKHNELLVIHRFGIPDLPKGKIEQGENPKNAALREVSEECGISNLTVSNETVPSFHIYKVKEQIYLKKTFWFNMRYNANEVLIPQKEELITKAEWCDHDLIKLYKNKTYESLRRYFI